MKAEMFDPGLARLLEMFSEAGCTRLFAKRLAENDNTKNQVYFGGGFHVLHILPIREVRAGEGASPIFKAGVSFGWLQSGGDVARAPGAQLILYPQYPEVRFSGFLQDCRSGQGPIMGGRIAGRILFLGVAADSIIGFAAGPGSVTASEYNALDPPLSSGVFAEVTLPDRIAESGARARLLAELRRIHELGWIDSKQLDSHGNLRQCRASQCGGFTLEAELGIPKNSAAEPDYLGWEIKQHGVKSFERPSSGKPITLMTPEPTGGYYREAGVEAFVREFGYPDRSGEPDRFNVGGPFRVGKRSSLTGLTLALSGYDFSNDIVTDANGSLDLVSDDGIVAASWTTGSLLSHWVRKHEKAAYILSNCRKEDVWQYRYDRRIKLGGRTDPFKFLRAIASGLVFYDPGIKLEDASTKPRTKRRSQFRIKFPDIGLLYGKFEEVDLTE
jgi:hypothetical protein